jgi:hypothetical protein
MKTNLLQKSPEVREQKIYIYHIYLNFDDEFFY